MVWPTDPASGGEQPVATAPAEISTEAIVAQVYREVVGRTQVAPDADFFTIGGDSLKAALVVARVRDRLGVQLNVADVFEHSTVRALAAAASRRHPVVEMARIPRRGNLDPCALSSGQKRIWFLDQLEPGTPRHNIIEAFRWQGPLDVEALERAVTTLIERHEILRTTYHDVGGKPVQAVTERPNVTVTSRDVRHLPYEARAQEVQRLLEQDAARPFDLSQDLPIRVIVTCVDPDEWVLFMSVHHIACDGWSFNALHTELAELYTADRAGRAPDLPELPIQYADFALWDMQRTAGSRLDEGLKYWRRQLGGELKDLSFTGGGAERDADDARAGVETFLLPEALARRVRARAQQAGVSTFTVLVAAFQTLLGRLARQDDVIVGSAMARRARSECANLIGMLTDTVALRLDLSGDPMFDEVVRRAGRMVKEAIAYQDVPFERIVQEVNPSREEGRKPLFDIMLEFNSGTWMDLRVPGVSITPEPVANPLARFRLALHVNERPDGLHLRAHFRRASFLEGQVSRLLRQFARLLEAAIETPPASISTLPILEDAERHRLLVEWNDTRADYPSDRCAHQLIEAQVARTPDAVAICHEGRDWTFRDLNRHANRVAHHLRELGVGTGALVGIHMQRCPEMISALLGTLKAGGAYVPLDPQWPAARLALVIDDAQVVAVLTDATGEPELRRHVEHAICLDRDVGPTDDRDDENPRPVSGPRDLAYVVYTSGSTGRPKGVLIEHRSLVNYVSGVSRSLHLADLRSFAALQPLHVDSSVTAIYPPLFSGGRLHLISEDMALDPLALAAYFKTHDIECLKIAPSHLMALNAEVEQPIMPRKLLIVGGEEIQSEWVARLQGAAPDCRVVNHYGPTEATVGATAHPVVGHHSGRLPIGRLLPNVQAFVLDRYGSPVPIGVAGELYLGGDCLARGYLNLPDATAGAFVPDLLSGTDGARLYRTGDMVRYRPDGSLEFLGRQDTQVKVRGNRVELGEIEGAIADCANVADVAVVPVADSNEATQLVAVIVPTPGSTLSLAPASRFAQRAPPHVHGA